MRKILKRNRFSSILLTVVLTVTALASPMGSMESYARPLEQDIQAIMNCKTQEEKNVIILERVAQAQGMPIQSNDYTNWPEGPVVDAPAAVLMDVDTGAILYEKTMNETYYPASITKIMTALLAVENGNRSDEVIFSHEAIYNVEAGSASAGMKEGEKIDLDTCLRLMMSQSANECAYAVAETIGGDLDTFVGMMNDKAAELGCTDSHFCNPHGLFNEEHYVTAHDMALIAQAAYQYPWFREICNLPTYKRPLTELNPTNDWAIKNRHQMLHPENETYYYEGVTGGKTGFTDEARNTLVTYAERNGMRLVCVVLQTEGVRVYTSTKALLDYGFANFMHLSMEELLDTSVISSVLSGVGATVPAGTKSDQIFTGVSLDNRGLPTGVTGNLATASFQYYGKNAGEAELALRPSYAASLVQQAEEPVDTAQAEEETEEASERSKVDALREIAGKINPWMAGIAAAFVLALILMIIAIVNLRKTRRRKKRRK